MRNIKATLEDEMPYKDCRGKFAEIRKVGVKYSLMDRIERRLLG